jgi:hypothetical protein
MPRALFPALTERLGGGQRREVLTGQRRAHHAPPSYGSLSPSRAASPSASRRMSRSSSA